MQNYIYRVFYLTSAWDKHIREKINTRERTSCFIFLASRPDNYDPVTLWRCGCIAHAHVYRMGHKFIFSHRWAEPDIASLLLELELAQLASYHFSTNLGQRKLKVQHLKMMKLVCACLILGIIVLCDSAPSNLGRIVRSAVLQTNFTY